MRIYLITLVFLGLLPWLTKAMQGKHLCFQCTCTLRTLTCRHKSLLIFRQLSPHERFYSVDLMLCHMGDGQSYIDFVYLFPSLQFLNVKGVDGICPSVWNLTHHIQVKSDCLTTTSSTTATTTTTSGTSKTTTTTSAPGIHHTIPTIAIIAEGIILFLLFLICGVMLFIHLHRIRSQRQGYIDFEGDEQNTSNISNSACDPATTTSSPLSTSYPDSIESAENDQCSIDADISACETVTTILSPIPLSPVPKEDHASETGESQHNDSVTGRSACKTVIPETDLAETDITDSVNEKNPYHSDNLISFTDEESETHNEREDLYNNMSEAGSMEWDNEDYYEETEHSDTPPPFIVTTPAPLQPFPAHSTPTPTQTPSKAAVNSPTPASESPSKTTSCATPTSSPESLSSNTVRRSNRKRIPTDYYQAGFK